MQNIISNKDKQELLDLAKVTAQNYKIVACCIYGSKVAGYARVDSDYDLLLVLKDYDKLIEYVYSNKNDLNASILMVDSKALMKDAEKAALGEFVAGRLLHPYDTLLNNEYFEQVETTYKRRVIIDTIKELHNETLLYKEMIIPIKYFLLAKIRNRAKIYPHALYSYIKTYINEYGAKNLEFSLNGFMKALSILENDGYIKFYDKDNIMINKDLNAKGSYISNITNGILAYLVHFYAGRSTLNFFKQEAKSKLKRRKELHLIEQEFINPEYILRLNNTLLLHEDNYIEELLRRMNINDYELTIQKIGDIHSTTKLYIVKQKYNTFEFIAKHYASLKSLKWLALNIWMASLVKFDVKPSLRQTNEYKGLTTLKALGFNTPEIIGLSYTNKITITKYIHGITLDSIINDILANKSKDTSKIKEFGNLLYNIHKYGYIIRDTKATNVIISNDKLYLVDLEQFNVSNDATWDIACFIYYSLKFTNNEQAARMIVKAFLDGYTNNAQNTDCKSVIKKALNKKYLVPFYPAMVISVVKNIWDKMEAYT